MNLIGDEVKSWKNYASENDTSVHIYGKADVREGRKMGHITKLKPIS